MSEDRLDWAMVENSRISRRSHDGSIFFACQLKRADGQKGITAAVPFTVACAMECSKGSQRRSRTETRSRQRKCQRSTPENNSVCGVMSTPNKPALPDSGRRAPCGWMQCLLIMIDPLTLLTQYARATTRIPLGLPLQATVLAHTLP